MKAAWVTLVAAVVILIAAAVLSFQRSTAQKAIPRAERSDTWQKSKECAEQAEKIRGENNSSKNLEAGSVNHYSPKYNRCFVRITLTARHVKVGPGVDRTSSTMLMDAFEGSVGAIVPFTGPCYLGGEPADCAKTESFISNAMTH